VFCGVPIPRPEESYRVSSDETLTFYTYNGKAEEVKLRKNERVNIEVQIIKFLS
jgi:hypothetical protein